ncbi:transmembrane protein fates-shifted isoform X2 [Megalopta genalis]|uniref:transmembrane protein fates-shifted isoform X2 n=1 Tax=Megalopta genalis TaxID=115081 RepID=UPI001442E7B0|nr:transmembrane protein 183B isoform X2 [Megalopta genalis]
MPISRKRSSKRSNTETKNNLIGDVTINDFANSSRIHARPKKASIGGSVDYVEQKVTIDDEVWNETDQSYDLHLPDTDNFKKNSEGLTHQVRHKKTAIYSINVEEKEEEGIDYPLDVWFIISEYICPEAVGKFARICKNSYHVTKTGKFWFHLYKTYYRPIPGLPERLQPQCMVRMHGLRACVIRTLHYIYFASKKGIDNVSYYRQEDLFSLAHYRLHSLVKRKCCLMWHKKEKLVWYFYFKLKEIPKSSRNSMKEKPKLNGRKTDFIEMLEDVAVNPEQGCKLLRVACQRYSMLPQVTGLILQKVAILKQGIYQLQLGFGTSDVPNTLTHQVILNDVVDCQVLNWWHPSYPHQDTVTTIELPQNDSWDQNIL